MSEPTLILILQIVFAGGGLGTVFMGIRALLRGKKDDAALDSDIDDKMQARVERWLTVADTRLQAAENRAEKAETDSAQLRREFEQYKAEKQAETSKLVHQLQAVFTWIEEGAHPPQPSWPSWLPRPWAYPERNDKE